MYGLALRSVTKGWVDVKFMVKKHYVTLEWPLRGVLQLSSVFNFSQKIVAKFVEF